MRARLAILLALITVLAGCATVISYPPNSQELMACHVLINEFDDEVKRHKVFDAQDYPLPSFQYLRSDRLLAAYDLSSLPGPALDQWLQLLRGIADTA